VDLQRSHRGRRAAVGWIEVGRSSQRRNGGDDVGVVAGHPVNHEGPVGVAEEVDSTGVDAELRDDLVDQGPQVAGVIDAAAIDVTASVGRVPELVTVLVHRALREHAKESEQIRPRQEMHVVLRGLAGVPMPVKHHQEWRREGWIVGRWHVDDHRPTAEIQDEVVVHRADPRPARGRRREHRRCTKRHTDHDERHHVGDALLAVHGLPLSVAYSGASSV
jgi:hypothetical protein